MNWGYIFSHGVLIGALLFFVGSAIYWRSEAQDADHEAEQWEQKFTRLRDAVWEVYYIAHWRTTELTLERQDQLWKKLRDAAGFNPGGTIHYMAGICGPECDL